MFFCNRFLLCSQGVFGGLFLRVPRRFGVHFGVVLASFFDGKHASSAIEVESNLLEANLDGGVEGDVLGMRWEGCG